MRVKWTPACWGASLVGVSASRLFLLWILVAAYGTMWPVVSAYMSGELGPGNRTMDSRSSVCYTRCSAKCEDIRLGITTGQWYEPVNANADHNRTDEARTDEARVTCFIKFCGIYRTNLWATFCEEDSACLSSCLYLTNTSGSAAPPASLVEQVHLHQVSPRQVQIQWEQVTAPTAHTVLYLVEARPTNTSDWTRLGTTFHTNLSTSVDPCQTPAYHVAAVNQFGTMGFSNEEQRDKLPVPGPVRQDSSDVILEPVELARAQSFIYNMTFRPPRGWEVNDVHAYRVIHPYNTSCDPGSGTAPYPNDAYITGPSNNVYTMYVSIGDMGYGCMYSAKIIASSCQGKINGEPLSFDINLRNCSAIVGYVCPTPPYHPPGSVVNATVTVVARTRTVLIHWDPPFNLGTDGRVHRYVLQWGPIRYQKPFTSFPIMQVENSATIPGDRTDHTTEVNKTEISYGIKIVAAGLATTEDQVQDKLALGLPVDLFYVPKLPDDEESTSRTTTETGEPTAGTPTAITMATQPSRPEVEKPSDDPTGSTDNLHLLYIIVPLFLALMVATVCMAILIKRKTGCRTGHKLWDIVSGKGSNEVIKLQSNIPSGMVNSPIYINSKSADAESVDEWEIPRGCLTLGVVLGQGAFGQVVKGVLSLEMHKTPYRSRTSSSSLNKDVKDMVVAVKMLLDYCEDGHQRDFLLEMALMKKIGSHQHVVSIVGCITQGEPLCLIVEHVPNGDLLHFLRRHRHMMHEDSENDSSDTDRLNLTDLLSIARQIAVGMEFLAQKGFVHRDLATRNILVGENKRVKIGDFGLTRYIYEDHVYVTRKGAKLPLKWMAIEAISHLSFNTETDVWSFGVVLFELITLGGTPYPTIANKDLLDELRKGYRMERPDNCTPELYELMCQCWQREPKKRPTFTDLRSILDHMIQAQSSVNYLIFDLDESKDYYRVERHGVSSDGVFDDDNDDDRMFDSLSSISSMSTSPRQRVDSGLPDRSSLSNPSSSGDMVALTLTSTPDLKAPKKRHRQKSAAPPASSTPEKRGGGGEGGGVFFLSAPESGSQASTSSQQHLLPGCHGNTSDGADSGSHSWLGENESKL